MASCLRTMREKSNARNSLAGAAISLGLVFAAGSASGQVVIPPPQPTPGFTGNAYIASQFAALNLGSNFLERYGNLAARGAHANSLPGSNPQGGGGPEPDMLQRYRAWVEAYGIAVRTGAQNDFAGDRRSTAGGVAGFAYTLAPGLQIGASIDQSRSHISLVNAIAGAHVDLTQIGANLAWESGPWTIALAGVRGFGGVETARTDPIGANSQALYDVRLWGALGELSYLISKGQARIVPKAGFEWVEVETDAFAEVGGIAPITGTGQATRRTKVFAGAEFGYTWVIDKTLFDLAITGKAIDNVKQSGGTLQVSSANGATTPFVVQGLREGRYGVDAGAVASVILNPSWRLYAVYDGRFRENFASHGGTVGVEVKW